MAQLWRGTSLILKTSADLVDADTYQIIFPPPEYSDLDQEILSPRVEDALELLRRKASEYGHSKAGTPRRDTEIGDLATNSLRPSEPGTEYFAAIESLQETFTAHRRYPNRVLSWLVVAGSPFMDAVHAHEPLACAIFLLWSVTFHVLDNMWWATGFRRQLVNELVPVVSVKDPELAELAAWVESQT